MGDWPQARGLTWHLAPEYLRRVHCNLFGSDMENGLVPDDEGMVGSMISDICVNNAASYLGFKRDL